MSGVLSTSRSDFPLLVGDILFAIMSNIIDNFMPIKLEKDYFRIPSVSD